MKKHLIAAAALLLVGGGCTRATIPVNYRVSSTLYAIDAEGKESRVYLGSNGADTIVVSPDRKHAAYAVWKDAHYVILIEQLPDHMYAREVAVQSVPEGHGQLNVRTLAWIDDRTLYYQEEASPCGETGEPSTLNPTQNCDGSILLTNRVDIITSEKTVEKSWLTIKPLQP